MEVDIGEAKRGIASDGSTRVRPKLEMGGPMFQGPGADVEVGDSPIPHGRIDGSMIVYDDLP